MANDRYQATAIRGSTLHEIAHWGHWLFYGRFGEIPDSVAGAKRTDLTIWLSGHLRTLRERSARHGLMSTCDGSVSRWM